MIQNALFVQLLGDVMADMEDRSRLIQENVKNSADCREKLINASTYRVLSICDKCTDYTFFKFVLKQFRMIQTV